MNTFQILKKVLKPYSQFSVDWRISLMEYPTSFGQLKVWYKGQFIERMNEEFEAIPQSEFCFDSPNGAFMLMRAHEVLEELMERQLKYSVCSSI